MGERASESGRLKPRDRAGVSTERRNPRSTSLDRLEVEECLCLINSEDALIAQSVERAIPKIAAFVGDLEVRMRSGGRLIYVGAGTSGRLGVLDASECPPTFCTDPGLVLGVIAGGDAALRRSSEGLEDLRDGAVEELTHLGVGSDDTVLGIAAGGTTPYVLGAVEWARRQGALTGFLTCSPTAEAEAHVLVDHFLVIDTGPEVLTGSTRMKAGTATKMVVNMISTGVMVRLGKVYENLMVDVRATNDKLADRAARIMVELAGVSRDEAFQLLDDAGGSLKVGVVMHRHGVTRPEAERMLVDAGGQLREALDIAEPTH